MKAMLWPMALGLSAISFWPSVDLKKVTTGFPKKHRDLVAIRGRPAVPSDHRSRFQSTVRLAADSSSERRVVSHCLFKHCLQACEALIDGSRVVAIELDHLGAHLTAADHLESI